MFRIDSVSPLTLARGSETTRIPPRAEEHRQAGYVEQFDELTVFYDTFTRDGELVMVVPPLLNLTVDRVQGAAGTSTTFDLHKTVRVTSAAGDGPDTVVTVSGQSLENVTGEADWTSFAGRRVLVTMTKDNDRQWIREWISYYASTHGTDAVLLYNNGSTDDSEAILEAACADPGILTAVVVRWPFKYGPQGGPASKWDSDYSQVGALEQARQEYLGAAASVLHVDIDELVVSEASIHQLAERHGAVSCNGVWISAARVAIDGSSFEQFPFREPAAPPCATKWCVVPSRVPESAWLGVHNVFGVEVVHHANATYRHFRAITTNWKYNRTTTSDRPSDDHIDHELRRALVASAAATEARLAASRPAASSTASAPSSPSRAVRRLAGAVYRRIRG
jgi:hypothetical protein